MSVDFIVKVVPVEKVTAPLVAVAVGQIHEKVPTALLGLDQLTDRGITRLINTGDFRGERDQVAMLYPPKGAQRILLIGLGAPEEITRAGVRRAGGIAGRKALQLKVESLAFHMVHDARSGITPDAVAQVAVEGISQGAWRFAQLKAAEEKTKSIKTVDLIVTREERPGAEQGRRIGEAIAVGQRLARGLQALPGNMCTPAYLAEIAKQLSKAYDFRLTVLRRADLEKGGFGGLLSVAQGSAEEPRFIVLEYRGGGRNPPICLIGKGVTFDSGGISIKPAASMEDMKYDMSGAAAVLGTFEALGQLTPAINVVGLIPATENLPSGTAIKPGDVVRSHFGKTIEIINTDAEGRLILCDALSYARRYKPACVIDAATLTGAIVIALGNTATGLMGNDDQLLEEVRRAGIKAGERCWPLPLWDEYRELIKSDFADVKNSGGRAAGSITAGWFLREFVDGFPWAHLDIAGTAYTERDQPDLAKGPTGVGVRLFTEFVLGRTGG
jgi:leucyl aminopeptidase